jgi:2-alkenal reductase
LLLLLVLGITTTACDLLPSLTGQNDVPSTTVPTAVIEPTTTNTAVNNPTTETAIVVDPATGQTAVATVDTAAIAAEVLEQVQADLAAQPQPSGEIPPVNIQSSGALSVTDLEASLITLYQQVNQGVVYILVPPLGTGSGFVYSADGYIVTNNHVVSGGNSFEIVFSTGERREATLVGTDVDSDLAVLQVDSLPEGVTPLALADSDALLVGQLAVAIGNPFGEQGSMSLGIISGLGRSLQSQREEQRLGGGYTLPQVIQTDAPINPGNSGGPLLNMAGEVIGVNSAIATVTGTNSGVGFSIPVNAVKRIVPELIARGEYDYSYMGASFASEISLNEAETFGLDQTQGAYVLSVTEGTPADEAGLIPANAQTGTGGDLIIAIDGQPINDFADMNAYLVFNTSPGQTVQLTVLRNSSEATIPLTLGERP